MTTRTFIIAEAGVNHNGDLGRAKALVEAAREAGADAVKFQTFRAKSLATHRAPLAPYQAARAVGGSQVEMLSRLELGPREHQALVRHCVDQGIEFLSSPFDRDSLRMLIDECGVRRIKLGSGELTYAQLLDDAAQTGMPLLVSTGMATLDEVAEALQRMARASGQVDPGRVQAWFAEHVTLLHCTSTYPTPAEDVNLRAMASLRAVFRLPVGYSDHTVGVVAPLGAVAMGACVIEKHLTLDRTDDGPDHSASASVDTFTAMVQSIRWLETAMGDGDKRPRASERSQREVARRSLVAERALGAGTILDATMLVAKRPGPELTRGICPMNIEEVLGRTLTQDIEPDEPIRWTNLAE